MEKLPADTSKGFSKCDSLCGTILFHKESHIGISIHPNRVMKILGERVALVLPSKEKNRKILTRYYGSHSSKNLHDYILNITIIL